MDVRLKPDFERKLSALAALTGRAPAELLEDALAGYSLELAQTREMMDRRYDDLKSGVVQPLDGEAFFEGLRLREEELLTPRAT